MSRPTQIPVLDAASSPRWQSSSPRKSVTPLESESRSPSRRWSTQMQQHRDPITSRIATPRKLTTENEAQQRRQLAPRTSPRRSVSRPEDDLKLSAEICTTILKNRSAIDGKRSSRAVRVWDAVARCLEEIDTSDSSPATSPVISTEEQGGPSSPRQRGSSPPKRPTRKSVARLSAVGAPEGIQPALENPAERISSPQIRSRALFPCPFRKRNPARFNIRDHQICATAQFQSVFDLRDHVTAYHKRRSIHQCPRCGVVLETHMALNEHLVMPKDQMCELAVIHQGDRDDEDGIGLEAEQTLATWSVSDEGTWETVWRVVFPADRDVPDPDFHPVVELVEIERVLDDGQCVLKSSLQEKLRLLLPGTIEDSYCTFLTGQLELVFETHLANAMRQSLARSASTTGQVSPVPTYRTASAQREAQARRSTRRSRRSTMLQSIRFPDVELMTNSDKDIASTQHRMRQLDISPANTSHAEQRPATALRTEASASPAPSRASPLCPISHNVKSPSQTTAQIAGSCFPSAGCNDAGDYAVSRDCRDSGIGLHCEVCESEMCRCEDAIFSPAPETGRTGSSTTTPPPTASKGSLPGKPYQSLAGGSGPQVQTRHSRIQPVLPTPKSSPSLRHQPRLRVKTKEPNSSFEGFRGVPAGETFSPQSFKQRVLRTQQRHFAEQESWTG